MAQEPTQKKPGLLELLDEWEKQGASDAEIMEWTRKYLSYSAREKGVPLRGTFELTPLCNLNCKMCYVHLSDKQLRESGKRLLTVDEWKNIMQQAIDAGMIGAILTGGEAMLYPGFDDLYLFLQEKGIEITVKTNGLLMTEERIEFFKAHEPTGIQITLYGSDDDTYEKVTGHRCFGRVIDAIERIKQVSLCLEVMITPNRYMIQDMEGLLAKINDLGVKYQIGSGLFVPRDETGRGNESHDMTLDEYVALYKLEAKLKNRTLKPVCVDENDRKELSQQSEVGLRCGAARDGFAVNWCGDMMPCFSLEKICVNLLTEPFDKAWSELNRAVTVIPIPSECNGCTYQRLCPTCVVQHAYGAPPGHANPFFCTRARRLVAEGIYTVTNINKMERSIEHEK